jgi:hypothetical protein
MRLCSWRATSSRTSHTWSACTDGHVERHPTEIMRAALSETAWDLRLRHGHDAAVVAAAGESATAAARARDLASRPSAPASTYSDGGELGDDVAHMDAGIDTVAPIEAYSLEAEDLLEL